MPTDQEQAVHGLGPVVDDVIMPDSPAITILTAAYQQVTEVLAKAEATLQLLQQNLTQVSSQRIGLQHQKTMLIELLQKIKAAETTK
jgi:hypothetical protein